MTQLLYGWLHELLPLLLLSKEEEGKYYEILELEEILEFMSCNLTWHPHGPQLTTAAAASAARDVQLRSRASTPQQSVLEEK